MLTHEAAARLTFSPEVALPQIRVTLRTARVGAAGFVVSRRSIPSALVRTCAGLRVTAPALTALDLCADYGGDAIDAGLRSRRVTLADLYEALRLTSKRHGNGERRTVLLESRANPWSKAERTGACCSAPRV